VKGVVAPSKAHSEEASFLRGRFLKPATFSSLGAEGSQNPPLWGVPQKYTNLLSLGGVLNFFGGKGFTNRGEFFFLRKKLLGIFFPKNTKSPFKIFGGGKTWGVAPPRGRREIFSS